MTNIMPERTATPAELCDEISRAERARRGPHGCSQRRGPRSRRRARCPPRPP
jgi:hypothetical protein